MKRIISSLLCVVSMVCLLLPCTAFAVDNSSEKPVHFVSKANSENMLEATRGQITYSNLSVRELSSKNGINCRMEFSLNIGNSNYDIVTIGLLDEYLTETGICVYHGCLEGEVKIGETLYEVTVGLTKEKNGDAVNAGVVLMPYENAWSDEMVAFSLGEYVITKDVQEVLNSENFFEVENTSATRATNSGLGNVLSIQAGIADRIAQTIRVRVTPDIDAVRDYVNEHYSYTGAGAGAGFSLNRLQVGVKESSSYFTMAGVFTGAVEEDSEYEDFRSLIWAVICDVLSSYGVPTGTLTALLEDKTSDPVEVDAANECRITLSGSNLFDGVETYGAAGEFATAPNTSLTPGSDDATAYGEARFRIVQNIPLSGANYFYMNADRAEKDVEVTVG